MYNFNSNGKSVLYLEDKVYSLTHALKCNESFAEIGAEVWKKWTLPSPIKKYPPLPPKNREKTQENPYIQIR